MDGHRNHISVRIVAAANRAQIILLKLPSHLTDHMQPLDKCVFGPLKVGREKSLARHGRRTLLTAQNTISRKTFTGLLENVWKESITPSNIISGFRETGCYPVEGDKFSKEDFDQTQFERYHKRNTENLQDAGQENGKDSLERPSSVIPQVKEERRQKNIKLAKSKSSNTKTVNTKPMINTKKRRLVSFDESSSDSKIDTELTKELHKADHALSASSFDRNVTQDNSVVSFWKGIQVLLKKLKQRNLPVMDQWETETVKTICQPTVSEDVSIPARAWLSKG
ncbi:hypothetical protein PR048_020963 [Dryococelus australis]|uniref:DDE-1 domain-containing protein n=1 Tax=Dryococelus australis TaxID=614101 RepID=A0ABQ9GWX8_9NEOP|nr:hypothetical protein PR048_020963 [Dryococelus australis]